jgi:hypothetical protein
MNQDKGKAAAATPAEESGCSRRHAIVMTDEQVEVLRKQISIFATICDQLIEMHDGHAAHQGSIAGMLSPHQQDATAASFCSQLRFRFFRRDAW